MEPLTDTDYLEKVKMKYGRPLIPWRAALRLQISDINYQDEALGYNYYQDSRSLRLQLSDIHYQDGALGYSSVIYIARM